MRYTTDEQRLESIWAKVTKTDSCWLWNGRMTPDGYGRRSWRGKEVSVHKIVYSLLVADVPQGLVIDHLCRTRSCVNPEHMEIVTNRENVLRGIGIPAINKRKTHCKRGHELNEVNSRIDKRGGRYCELCRYIRCGYSLKKFEAAGVEDAS